MLKKKKSGKFELDAVKIDFIFGEVERRNLFLDQKGKIAFFPFLRVN